MRNALSLTTTIGEELRLSTLTWSIEFRCGEPTGRITFFKPGELYYASIIGLGPAVYDQRQVEAWASGCGSTDYTAAIEGDMLDYVVADRDGVTVGFGSLKKETLDNYEADIGTKVTAVYVLPSVAREEMGTEIYTELERHRRKNLISNKRFQGYRSSGGMKAGRLYQTEPVEHEVDTLKEII